MRKFRSTDQEKRFDLVTDDVIELENGFFIIEIGRIAQAPDQEPGTYLFTVMGSQSFKNIHPDARFAFEYLFDPLPSLLDGKQGLLLRIDPDGNGDFIKQGERPPDQVHMTGR